MSYPRRNGRVERATSQWWRTPVVSACLRVLALLGFAAAAWIAGSSMAHADAGTPAASADSTAAPVTSVLEPTLAPVSRPLTKAVTPVARHAAVAVSPVTGSSSGALAPATTPASDASVVDGAASLVTPVRGLVLADGRQSRSPALLGGSGSALLDPVSVTQGITTSLGVDGAVAPLTTAVRPLAGARPLTDRISSVVSGLPRVKSPTSRLPIVGNSPWTGDLPVPATAEGSLPDQAALPAVPVGHFGFADFTANRNAAQAAYRPDASSGRAVGAGSSAPTSPTPGPGSVPVFPGVATHGGSAAGSSSHQLDGSSGAVGAGGLSDRMFASRAFAVTEDSGVTLVRAEDPSVSPD